MTYSLTKIKMHEQCGAKYKYRYIDKIKEKPNEFAARGTEIHSALEGFVRDGTPLTGKLEFYHGFLKQLKQHPVPLFTEERIAIRKDWTLCPDREEPYILAYIDLARYVEVSAQLYDWKSGKIYPDHDDQKELYSGMVMAARPEIQVVTFTHVYVDLGKNREKVYSREFDYQRIKDKWTDKIKILEETDERALIPKPQFLCRYCSYSRANGGPCRF